MTALGVVLLVLLATCVPQVYRVTLVASEVDDSMLADVRQYLAAFAAFTDPDMHHIWAADPSRLLLEDHDVLSDVRKVLGGFSWGLAVPCLAFQFG
jgi:hypothetical protein